MILHSKITKINQKRPQITPDHARCSQEHAFGTYFLTGPSNNVSSLSYQNEGVSYKEPICAMGQNVLYRLVLASTHVEKKQAICITSQHSQVPSQG